MITNYMIFPCMELFLVIFQVFHDFQSLWEPCYAYVVRGARGLNVGLSLHQDSFFKYASSEGSGESAHTRLSIYCLLFP